jgi:hypothetical protein
MFYFLAYYLTLKIEALIVLETQVKLYRTNNNITPWL